jgi:hypothetical protein
MLYSTQTKIILRHFTLAVLWQYRSGINERGTRSPEPVSKPAPWAPCGRRALFALFTPGLMVLGPRRAAGRRSPVTPAENSAWPDQTRRARAIIVGPTSESPGPPSVRLPLTGTQAVVVPPPSPARRGHPGPC